MLIKNIMPSSKRLTFKIPPKNIYPDEFTDFDYFCHIVT